MPERRPNSRFWKVRRRHLPGYGDTGLLSTGSTSVKRAREMEDLLEWLADEEAWDVLDALRPVSRGARGRTTLADVLRAKKENRFASFRRQLDDPPLDEALRAFAMLRRYDPHKRGIRHVLRIATEPGGPRLAGLRPRLSWLTRPKNLDRLTHHLIGVEGYKPNTVRVWVWQSISKLLVHHYGEARKNAIFAEADRPGEDDSRDVWLLAGDVHRVVSACEWEVRMVLLLMAAVGIDVKPLLALRVRDFDSERWTLFVPDTKNRARLRTVDLAPAVVYALLQLTDGRAPEDSVVSLSRSQLNYRWRKAREAAKLTVETGFRTDVRLKDLRHTFAVHYLKGGANVAALSNRMGHLQQIQSLAYAKHETRGTDDVEAASASMGLQLPPRLAAELEQRAPRPGSTASQTLEMPAWWFDRHALPRIEGEEVSGIRGYAERGTAGWESTGEGRRAYERGLRERGLRERRAG